MKKRIVTACIITMTLLVLTPLARGNNATQKTNLLHQVKFGILAHDVGGLWSGSNREDGVDLNIEAILGPSYTILGGTLRPAIGGSINTAGDTSKGYIDALWQYDFNNKIFLVIGLGAAVHSGKKNFTTSERKALGSRILFHVPLELGYYVTSQTTVSVYFDHISNANTADENEGLDTIGVRFGYIF
jgi:lipid A 3-O-deacylase